MKHRSQRILGDLARCSALAAVIFALSLSAVRAANFPDPAVQEPASGPQTVVFAGGCFWGMQDVFEHVKGVSQATAGYAGGQQGTAQYDSVSTGTTGHAESVKVVYDPAQVSFGQLLKVYFSVAHNPTELNRQGPDEGTQYRSEIFTTDAGQATEAQDYIAQLGKASVFSKPIVTQVAPLPGFYKAEDYHQNYADAHPLNPYIVINDRPKLESLKSKFPALYSEQGAKS